MIFKAVEVIQTEDNRLQSTIENEGKIKEKEKIFAIILHLGRRAKNKFRI